MNLVEAFCKQVIERHNSIAMVETKHGKSRSITFSELDIASKRAAAMLKASGILPGDGVVLLQPMSIDLYIALIAIFRLGLVAIVFDPSAGRKHIERCCEIYPPAAFIGCGKAHLLRIISGAIRRIPRKFAIGATLPGTISWGKIDSYNPDTDIQSCNFDTPALLTFTSGSTGQPKAAIRKHGFLLDQHRILVSSLDLRAGEIDMTTLPIFALANLASGVTSIIPDGDLRSPASVNAKPILAQIAAWRPTRTSAPPAFFDRLAEYCLQQDTTIPHIEKIYTGGAPVFLPFLRKLQKVAPNASIMPVYGSTEAEPIAHLNMEDITEDDYAAMINGKGLLAGKPVAYIKLQIMKHQWGQPVGPFSISEFNEQCQSAGEPGEIVVSGAHVLPGYLHGNGDKETKFQVDGIPWHRTGDEGYIDDRGRLWLLGRCIARVNDERGIVYPFAVESAAMNHPAVKRAALILHHGDRVLVVEPDDNKIDLKALKYALNNQLIDDILIVKHIPVDSRHNSKVDYPALMRMIESGGYSRE